MVYRKRRMTTRRRRQKGGAFGSRLKKWLKKANSWLRKTKAISKVSGTLSNLGVPHMGKVSRTSAKLGYGMKGKGLRRAGAGRKRVVRRTRRY